MVRKWSQNHKLRCLYFLFHISKNIKVWFFTCSRLKKTDSLFHSDFISVVFFLWQCYGDRFQGLFSKRSSFAQSTQTIGHLLLISENLVFAFVPFASAFDPETTWRFLLRCWFFVRVYLVLYWSANWSPFWWLSQHSIKLIGSLCEILSI